MRRRKQIPSQRLPKSRVLLGVALVIGVFLVFFIREMVVRGPDNFSIVYPEENGSIKLMLYDLANERSVKLDIPGDVEVNLAMGRGILRAKNVKRLIDSENLPGQLLADTIMKTLRLPVDYWSGDVPLSAKIAIIAHNLRGSREDQISLENSPYLLKTKLIDGEEGYKVSGSLTLSLVSLFSDPSISKNQTAVRLVNRTGDNAYDLSHVVEVLEVLGAKPVPPLKEDPLDADCVVKANDAYTRARVASIFNCSEDPSPPEAFDIELILGSHFSKRF